MRLIEDAEWYQVYDVIERLVELEGSKNPSYAHLVHNNINGL
ncbi:hypothetical protein ATPR_3170 [Acetobacter tropicalis NBRC 101654]|uniref:Uncharacterized protein n=1 Tax=Acetobacter tropicalis NBRC 101654 TaxID=749388 RepID=F7VIH1_9PROT|nr:hypothetical protein ATPR_3170 [Acetobacter tropicalis NBRC 101654]